ncbi:metal ABC transporter substrate-binding protein [Algiphilus sp.]|uniref:metal ABC transporter substrate-binding protein n=2 Tax=Algiphilus sp. TaxID=1872431 RepID=UPI0032EB18B5
MKRNWMSGLVLLLAALPAAAEIRVAATTANMGMLVETVGGEAVEVTVMAPNDRDPHYLEARPSMMAALRNADMVVAVGAELEIGWLPAAIDGANNGTVQPGQSGYFELARHIELIKDEGVADRARGDVHPVGNPHAYMNPENLAQAGRALAERFASLDEGNAETFRANAEAFAAQVAEKMDAWRQAMGDPLPVLSYHGDVQYLAQALNIPLVGTIEPLPGVPPTASHLSGLVRDLKGGEGVVVARVYQPDKPSRFMAQQLGWPVHLLPSDVNPGEGADAYLELIGRWVAAMTHKDA